MALPLQGNNLVGTLTLASSGSTGSGVASPVGELNIPIGTSIANGDSVTSANISLPSTAMTCIALVQLSSGTAVISLDTTSDGTTPDFSGGSNTSVTVYRGEPVFLNVDTASVTQTNTNGVITNNTVENLVALKIQNNAGAALTVTQLRLISAVVYGAQSDWFTVHTGFLNAAAPSPEVLDGSGVFDLNT